MTSTPTQSRAPAGPPISPEEEQRRKAERQLRFEEIKIDVVRAAADMAAAHLDTMPIAELRERYLQRLFALPAAEHRQEIEQVLAELRRRAA
jgi:hypothetical protein